ncbi:hypothetical protein PAHAL_2G446500 [Panicum hallii]|uniref:Uncharacterized protein n=1 Tax=Panicum hallii TaxID=206008 RepID=A0A2S3H3Y3_9POAL|nr:hypothetical protein PAHAL_2G446500 [Panicum hallii]
MVGGGGLEEGEDSDFRPDLQVWPLRPPRRSTWLRLTSLPWTLSSQPQIVGAWKELCLPEQWKESKVPQFVILGSGRFCIARFFFFPTTNLDDLSH